MGKQDTSMHSDATKTQPELVISHVYTSDSTVTLFHGDRLDLLKQIADSGSKAELIVTSPPYNMGREYEKALPLPEYVADQRKTIKACLEILSPTGSICWQVGQCRLRQEWYRIR